jgi:hypothetical protein
MPDIRALRIAVLESCGAPPDLIDELLEYGEQPCRAAEPPPRLPLADEPHVGAWLRYAREAREQGALDALRAHLVQLRFPIRDGISLDDAYRRATRQGDGGAAAAFSPGLVLEDPDSVRLAVLPTIAGRVPVIVAGHRRDFVRLVQALSARNEPEDVPPAMGACLVKGLNNWSRVAEFRETWQHAHPGVDWSEGFAELAPQQALYQDRFIILSAGRYSNLDPAAAGMDEPGWLAASLDIRREHELTHYFVYRVFGVMRTHVFDEIVADFIGIGRALGAYRPDLALRCLGLEDFPRYRRDGRLAMYYAAASLSPRAVEIVHTLVCRAVTGLGRLAAGWPRDRWHDLGAVADTTYALSLLTLEELASDSLSDYVTT